MKPRDPSYFVGYEDKYAYEVAENTKKEKQNVEVKPRKYKNVAFSIEDARTKQQNVRKKFQKLVR